MTKYILVRGHSAVKAGGAEVCPMKNVEYINIVNPGLACWTALPIQQILFTWGSLTDDQRSLPNNQAVFLEILRKLSCPLKFATSSHLGTPGLLDVTFRQTFSFYDPPGEGLGPRLGIYDLDEVKRKGIGHLSSFTILDTPIPPGSQFTLEEIRDLVLKKFPGQKIVLILGGCRNILNKPGQAAEAVLSSRERCSALTGEKVKELIEYINQQYHTDKIHRMGALTEQLATTMGGVMRAPEDPMDVDENGFLEILSQKFPELITKVTPTPSPWTPTVPAGAQGGVRPADLAARSPNVAAALAARAITLFGQPAAEGDMTPIDDPVVRMVDEDWDTLHGHLEHQDVTEMELGGGKSNRKHSRHNSKSKRNMKQVHKSKRKHSKLRGKSKKKTKKKVKKVKSRGKHPRR